MINERFRIVEKDNAYEIYDDKLGVTSNQKYTKQQAEYICMKLNELENEIMKLSEE